MNNRIFVFFRPFYRTLSSINQDYYNKDMDELQESYQLYEDKLNVCQRRVRQCLVELRDAGFIEVENRTIIKDNVKLRNVPICF
ncbi:Uncharacterised protein [Orientia tsutsugamushi]|uniref:Uncharacterized protein n=2 Tax=Orientia tsutsugamushi TaxID=784 RepID=A0A2U3QMX0_ORITS|nr:Uncharacterised protein [Orientia tsutsugamushi]